MNQLLPLSATIIPYFFSAVSTTRAWPVYDDTSKLAFNRNRRPMGGRFGSVDDDAQCVAGCRYARWLRDTVNRSAWSMWPLITSS